MQVPETQAPETTVIELEIDHDWATLWLNRPDARNAMSDELVSQLQATLDYIAQRSDLRGVTVRGRGEVFCAGGDLKGFKDNFQSVRSLDEVIADSSKMGKFFLTVRSMPQVVVFLVHGAAMAGGLGMACAGDIVIAQKDTRMALTETAIGIVPAQIGRFIVERIGEFNARYIMLTAQRFTALEGKAYGLVDFLVDDMSAGEAKLAEIIAGVRRCAPMANAATKRLLQANKELGPQEMIHYAGTLFAQAVQSDEGREGVASFLEKRKPNWVREQ
ncbi:enoyl-CoA hydratase-related protein [Alphaproteobacteria bacterium]|nr:enoyl-CoA hydratase-related protein [Alphaproteobacteria bacterium]